MIRGVVVKAYLSLVYSLVEPSSQFYYSLVNLIAVEINNTDDYSYANYITTFLVWAFSVYPAIRCIRIVHGEVTVSRITYYLVGVTVFQCITGLLNDNFPAAQNFTDSIVFWAGDFYESIDRIRCFSVALDPAGVRFSLVLILISAVICSDAEVQRSRWTVFLLLISLYAYLGNREYGGTYNLYGDGDGACSFALQE